MFEGVLKTQNWRLADHDSFHNRCTFTAKRGEKVGWKPIYAPEHILETADAEVELILEQIKAHGTSLT